MRAALLAFIIPFTFFTSAAYDFAAKNEDGTTIYYNITGSEAQVTFDRQFAPTESYVSSVTVPKTVNHEGVTYTVTSIGRNAFFSSAVENIILPESITSIGDFAFAGSSLLKSIKLPAGVADIGINVFDGCFSLTDIDIAGTNTEYRSISGVLYDKPGTSLLIYPQGRDSEAIISPATESLGARSFYGCYLLPEITIPQGVKIIGDNTFYFCNNLTSVSLPASVTSIGRSAFADCINLTSIGVDADNPAYSSVDGSLLDKEAKILLQSPAARVGSCAIPETVTAISDLAFFRNIGVTTALIPEGTTVIGNGSFTDCQSLTAVVLPFTVKEIGSLAFALCGALEAVYVKNPNPGDINICADAFTGIDPDTCFLYVPAGSLGAYATSDAWSVFKTIIEYDSLTPQQIVWDTKYTPDGQGYVSITLDAEATSGLPVSYTIAPESVAFASITGNQLTMQADTNVKVTATQNGNNSYQPAEPVTRIIGSTDALDSPVSDSGIRVSSGPGTIIIVNIPSEEPVRVYDVAGRSVYAGTDHTIKVASGQVYIVNVGKQSFKVPVK